MEIKSNLSESKKIIYFLMACDSQQTKKILKYSFLIQENKRFPISFIKNSKSFFIKNRKYIAPQEGKNLFSAWKFFCKTSTYEEVLLLILYGILKYPKEKLSWLLNIPLEIVSYRIEQGLVLLSQQLFNKSSEINSLQTENIKMKEKTLDYCQELADQPLPIDLEKLKINKKSKKIKYLLWIVISLIVFSIFIWVLSFVFSNPKTIILYHSFLFGNRYGIFFKFVILPNFT